jgi:pSer/pThr/pTyr-binding forkhead associated (FHA) protein
MAFGNIKVNPETPHEYSVELADGEVLQIGRRPAPDGVKKLIFPYPEVSGLHAEISCNADGWTIIDRNSTNGTTINGKVCVSGEEYPLRHGDEVRVAQYQLRVFPPRTEFELDALGTKSEDQFRAHVKLPNMPVQELPDLEDE